MCDFLINRLRMRKICRGQMWKEDHCVRSSKMTKEELRRFQATMRQLQKQNKYEANNTKW